jgi:phosphate transport system substrate-binding protein
MEVTRLKFVRSAVLCLSGAIAFLGCDRTPPPGEDPASHASTPSAARSEGPVRVSGSSALQPLINAAKERFEVQNRGASVEVSAGGSKKGLVDVASGAVQIGASDVFAGPDQAGLIDHRIAAVGFAAMANKGPYDERITVIGLDQLAKIFRGEIKNWKELGGGSQPIIVINRAPASGTRTVFGNVILGGDNFVESQTEDNSGALVTKLEQTPGAISYLALSFQEDGLLTLSLRIGPDTIAPTPEAIGTGTYPLWAYEHLYTKGEASGETKKFIDYVLSPDFQSQLLPAVKGFIPISLMKIHKDRD